MNLSAARFTRPTAVMAGLDPAIHPTSQKRLWKAMDRRVKPGGDEWNVELSS